MTLYKSASQTVDEPLDLIRLSIDNIIYVKYKYNRDIIGKLIAYDQHLNMILQNVTETIYTTIVDAETKEEVINSNNKVYDLLYIRGDGVVLVSSK